MWNDRYQNSEYVYGKEPNDFLKTVADQLPAGDILCLAEGEGRNAVFLAQRGCSVTAVDASAVGLKKAQKLATEHKVEICSVVADLADYTIAPNSWNGIISIFCHLPPPLRKKVHRAVVQGLKPGGLFILEAYTPKQLEFGTGGPPKAELMMSLSVLKEELAGLEFDHATELQRDVVEGSLHTGTAAVVQLIARKPSA